MCLGKNLLGFSSVFVYFCPSCSEKRNFKTMGGFVSFSGGAKQGGPGGGGMSFINEGKV